MTGKKWYFTDVKRFICQELEQLLGCIFLSKPYRVQQISNQATPEPDSPSCLI